MKSSKIFMILFLVTTSVSTAFAWNKGDRIQTQLCPTAGDQFDLYTPPASLFQFSMEYILDCNASVEYFFVKSAENNQLEVVGKIHKSIPASIFFRKQSTNGEAGLVQSGYDVYSFYFAEGPNCPNQFELHSISSGIDPNTFEIRIDQGVATGICSDWDLDQFGYYPRLANFIDINSQKFQTEGLLDALIFVENPQEREQKQLLWIRWNSQTNSTEAIVDLDQSHLSTQCGNEFIGALMIDGPSPQIALFDSRPGIVVSQINSNNKLQTVGGAFLQMPPEDEAEQCLFPTPNFASLKPGLDNSFALVHDSLAQQIVLTSYVSTQAPVVSIRLDYASNKIIEILGSGNRSFMSVRSRAPTTPTTPGNPNTPNDDPDDDLDINLPF